MASMVSPIAALLRFPSATKSDFILSGLFPEVVKDHFERRAAPNAA